MERVHISQDRRVDLELVLIVVIILVEANIILTGPAAEIGDILLNHIVAAITTKTIDSTVITESKVIIESTVIIENTVIVEVVVTAVIKEDQDEITVSTKGALQGRTSFLNPIILVKEDPLKLEITGVTRER